ncbi:hypothetical protein SEA_SICARIUS2_11 [Arthrobacter phage Sicarius2]|uniref:Uncharacterized protein n=1 Tax=Arthrobacter phage Sicarius2 TaxID=2836090 RepID=A0A8F3E5P3_9CAUD|nr:hypothetical protein SEA_SICARIUS2_11 [Arthrobacter phage Sicarius2]
MAARNTRQKAAAADDKSTAASTVESDLTATQPQTLADAFSVSTTAEVVTDEEVEALKAADAADDVAETEEQRAAQLQKFVTGETDAADAEAAAPDVEIDVSSAKDFGGDNLVIVLFDYYRVRIAEGNRTLLAHKGELIKVDDKTAAHGVRIGGLREIEG